MKTKPTKMLLDVTDAWETYRKRIPGAQSKMFENYIRSAIKSCTESTLPAGVRTATSMSGNGVFLILEVQHDATD